MGERQGEKAARAAAILDRLTVAYPHARIALDYRTPYELLVAVVLSAQCTDARVNLITPALFARFPTVEALAEASPELLEPLIRSCGLFRAKARALIETCRLLRERFDGAVPSSRAQLASLPGLGNKSAGVVAMHLGGEPALPVDTHVARLAFRLGLSASDKPDRIEQDLCALLPYERWSAAHHLLIAHGRTLCLARTPWCSRCPIAGLCPRRGVHAAR